MSSLTLRNTIRDRLLNFTRLQGSTLAQILGSTQSGAGQFGKLYHVQAPDNVTDPANSPSRWGVYALKNRRRNAENAERELVDLEVMLFARPRNQQDAMEDAADACDEAMRRYEDFTNDVIGCWGSIRNTLPVMAEPADREVVQIRLVYTLVVYPDHLTQYETSA